MFYFTVYYSMHLKFYCIRLSFYLMRIPFSPMHRISSIYSHSSIFCTFHAKNFPYPIPPCFFSFYCLLFHIAPSASLTLQFCSGFCLISLT
uniref:Uncharacterized protein n=1 Tax=Saccharolobus islandicus TaxID=43080 RepID=Q54320_SACIS|nr:ORF90a; Method: conceptual translation supplied by author [Sulfolobus islandicus]BAF62546.1 orf90a [synthetic construct]